MSVFRHLPSVLVAVTIAACARLPLVREASTDRARIRSEIEEMRTTVDALHRELDQLRGEIGKARWSGRERDTITARLERLEQRVGSVEGGMSPPMSVPPPRDEPTKTPPGSTRSAPPDWPGILHDELAREDKRDVPGEYRHALRLIRDKAYEHAVQSLYAFLRTTPGSPLAADCHYWIGASYYLLGEYYRAILSFNEVRQQYTGSSRAPGAALMIGFAFLQMGNKEEARLAFEKIVSDYPASREAAQARERLQDLGT